MSHKIWWDKNFESLHFRVIISNTSHVCFTTSFEMKSMCKVFHADFRLSIW